MPMLSFEWFPTRGDAQAMLRLATPVVVVQVGLMLMGVVDTMMVGRVSAEALAAVALGNVYVWAVAVLCIGVLMALDPLVAQAVGAGDEPAVARAMQRGLILALALAALTAVVFAPAEPVMAMLGQSPQVVPDVGRYTRISAAGMWPFYAFMVLRQTLQAMGRLRPIVIAIVVANVFNAIANWALIFGHLGFEPMGVAGSAWATAAGRWFMLAMLAALAWRWLRPSVWPVRPEVWQLKPLWRTVRIGLPIGGHMGLEFAAFALIALLMGTLGTIEMAAHQIAINLASLSFMVPLGIGQAAAVLVGRAIGAGRAAEARRMAVAALMGGAAIMLLSAALFLAVPTLLAGVYTDQAAVIALAAMLIPIAGVFQVFDGLQAVSAGVLRGVADTTAPMLINVLGFWVFGVPLSWLLAFEYGGGAVGLWWGLVAGLGAVAIMLLLRIAVRLRRPLDRLIVDHPPQPWAEP